MNKPAVFVVGMGRSGTSALARVLAFGGARLPRNLMKPNHGNTVGYWEPQAAVDLNDQFLSQYRSSWYNPALAVRRNLAVTAFAKAKFITRANEVIETEYGDAEMIVLKDPRISELLWYWTAAAEAAGLSPVVVHTFRHPHEVAASLARRDHLEQLHSDALWLKYNLLAETDSRPYPRVFCSFDELVADWRALVDRIAQTCDVPLAYNNEAACGVEQFLRRNMRHHVDTEPPAGGPAYLLPTVYDCLQQAAVAGRIAEAVMDDAMIRYRSWIGDHGRFMWPQSAEIVNSLKARA